MLVRFCGLAVSLFSPSPNKQCLQLERKRKKLPYQHHNSLIALAKIHAPCCIIIVTCQVPRNNNLYVPHPPQAPQQQIKAVLHIINRGSRSVVLARHFVALIQSIFNHDILNYMHNNNILQKPHLQYHNHNQGHHN